MARRNFRPLAPTTAAGGREFSVRRGFCGCMENVVDATENISLRRVVKLTQRLPDHALREGRSSYRPDAGVREPGLLHIEVVNVRGQSHRESLACCFVSIGRKGNELGILRASARVLQHLRMLGHRCRTKNMGINQDECSSGIGKVRSDLGKSLA